MPALRTDDDPLCGLTVLERGWLSSNNLLIHAAPGEAGSVLVDASHVNHAAQTLALVAQALQAAAAAQGAQAGRLHRLVNTHLHSDHCGGNAQLQAAHGAELLIPPGHAALLARGDAEATSWHQTGQVMEAFRHDGVLRLDAPLQAGGRDWQVLQAPGHDPDSVMLFDAAAGVLVSADALWEQGFGVVFPEIEGEPGFDDVGAVLDLIATLPVRVVIPGHGRPFTDVAGALARARARLAGFQADPSRHARHAIKVLVKYHLMELQHQPLAELLAWAQGTPLLRALWQRHRPAGMASAEAWLLQTLEELVAGGALRRDGDQVRDRGA